MDILENIKKLSEETNSLIESLNAVIKSRSNKFYINNYIEKRTEFHRTARTLELMLHRYGKKEEEKKISEVISEIMKEKSNYKENLQSLLNFQKFLIDLEVICSALTLPSFEVPSQIPFNEVRLDLEEAISNFDNKCYLSSQVMCRRAYEGALREKYKEVEGQEPKEDFKCPHCKNVLRSNSDIPVVKLHRWALDKEIIHQKFQNAGFLIPEFGAGAAHPSEKPFPREKQVAKLALEATMTLLTYIYSNQKENKQ